MQGYALNSLGHALLASDHPAVAVRRELGQSHLAAESLAGLAGARLVHGDSEQSLDCVEDVLTYLEANTLAGMEEPFRVYLACYQVLENHQDPRAQVVLEEAYRLLAIVRAWEGEG